jgi:hypothetical protein
MTRRDFVKAVALTAVMPVADTSPALAWAVSRASMWAPDADSTITLARCNRLLATNPDDVLSLVHRGQLPSIYLDPKQAWTDLTRAITLEPSPCCFYLRGTCFNVVADLRHAVSLLSMSGDIDGRAICTSQPDIYKWHGSDDGELYYMAQRELGSILEEKGRIGAALVAFERAASFRVIAQADLERWCEADIQVGRVCEAVIGYRSLTEVENRAEYRRRLQEAESWLRVPRHEWWESRR